MKLLQELGVRVLLRRICLSAVFVLLATQTFAASFVLGNNANLSGVSGATLNDGGVAMSIAVAANLPGAVFDTSDSRGVTINSSAVVGITDIEGSGKINLLGGPIATESLTFSFDTAGVIDDMFFDGISDESLEFFRLESTDGYLATFFDFEMPLRVDVNLVTEPNINYLQTSGVLNDDLLGIAIPFQAGEVFTLSYGQLDSLVDPQYDPGNGARFGGMNVRAVTVPEPTSLWLLATVAGALCAWQRLRKCSGR